MPLIHPRWSLLIPPLRAALDRRGLGHVAILERSAGMAPDGPAELLEQLARGDESYEEWITFQPRDPGWRTYRAEPAPFEGWLEAAQGLDRTGTPSVSLAADGRWEVSWHGEQGLLAAETFSDDESLRAWLLDRLADHFGERCLVVRRR